MKLAETIVEDNLAKIYQKRVLEIAAGEATLSLACAEYANYVLSTDIELTKLSRIEVIPENMHVKKMDATRIDELREAFDTVICYNSIAHLVDVLELIIDRYLAIEDRGLMMFINTWKMDKAVTYDVLLPLLDQKHIKYSINQNPVYQSVSF